jgi:hypothetical protein
MTEFGSLIGWHNVPSVIASLSSNPSCRPDRSGGTTPHFDRRDLGSRFDYAQPETGVARRARNDGDSRARLDGAQPSTFGIEPAPFMETFRSLEPQSAALLAAAR